MIIASVRYDACRSRIVRLVRSESVSAHRESWLWGGRGSQVIDAQGDKLKCAYCRGTCCRAAVHGARDGGPFPPTPPTIVVCIAVSLASYSMLMHLDALHALHSALRHSAPLRLATGRICTVYADINNAQQSLSVRLGSGAGGYWNEAGWLVADVNPSIPLHCSSVQARDRATPIVVFWSRLDFEEACGGGDRSTTRTPASNFHYCRRVRLE